MVTGWLKIGNDYYYLKADGSMSIGWRQIENSSVNLLPILCHGSVGGIHVVPVGIVAEPSGHHLAVGVKVIVSIVQVEPSILPQVRWPPTPR